MRLFLGFLPVSGERHIYSVCQRLAPSDPLPLTWVPEENWHVTLAFLGQVQARAVARLDAAVATVVSGSPPLEMTLSGLEWFPSALKPRLLALRVDASDALLQLQSAVVSALRREGFHSENRPYRPHLTLARVKVAKNRFNPPALPTIAPFDIKPDAVVLFESVPGRRAPVYRPLQHFELAS